MAAKMAAKNYNLMYLSFPLKCRDKESVYSYKMMVEEYEYVEINNISCISSKMAAKMVAEN